MKIQESEGYEVQQENDRKQRFKLKLIKRMISRIKKTLKQEGIEWALVSNKIFKLIQSEAINYKDKRSLQIKQQLQKKQRYNPCQFMSSLIDDLSITHKILLEQLQDQESQNELLNHTQASNLNSDVKLQELINSTSKIHTFFKKVKIQEQVFKIKANTFKEKSNNKCPKSKKSKKKSHKKCPKSKNPQPSH